MADPTLIGAIGAAATSLGAAAASVVGAFRTPTDVAALRAEFAKARDELSPVVKKAIADVSALIDTKVREDLNSLAQRVDGHEERFRRHRKTIDELKNSVRELGSAGRSGANLAPQSERGDLERRVSDLEDQAREEARVFVDLRVLMEKTSTEMQNIKERIKERGDRGHV